MLKSIPPALLTSVLLVLSFPDYNQSPLIWLALVPLILLCQSSGFITAFLFGLLSGTVAAFGIFFWIFEVPGFRWYHFIILGTYLGLYPALWCSGVSFLRKYRYAALIAIPALWCSLDYLKNHIGFMAFPWASLAHSQHENISLIQLASYAGEYGVTFLIVMINAAVALAFATKTWRLIVAPVLTVVVIYCWGLAELSFPDTGKQFKVTAVQPAFTRNDRRSDEDLSGSIEKLGKLTISIASEQPDLVVWPETAVGKIATDNRVLDSIKHISSSVNAPIITGSSEVLKFAEREEIQNKVSFNNLLYNSAYLIDSSNPLVPPYRKRRLVPFSEYNPEPVLIRFPTWLVSDSFNITAGDSSVHFQIDDYLVSPIICWENLFGDSILELAREGSDLIVQLTNDNRFGKTAAPIQHNIASVFRAVENRIPVVIASNTGPSQIIDQYGRVVGEVPHLFEEGVVTVLLSLRQDQTFYTRYGDLFSKVCITVTLILLVGGSIFFFRSLFK